MIKFQNSVYDLVILGGGPAGMSSALAGIRAGKRVLLIDRGINNGDYLHVNGLVNISNNVGGILGIGNVWGAQLTFPTARDIEHFLEASNHNVVKKYYKGLNAIASLLNIEIENFNRAKEFDSNFCSLDTGFFSTIYSVYLPHVSLLNYFQEVTDSPNFKFAQGTIQSLNIDEKMELNSINCDFGTLNTSTAKTVIALGALESCRILLKSLPNIERSIILDHPQGYIGQLTGKGVSALKDQDLFYFNNYRFRRKFLFRVENREGIVELHANLRLDKELFRNDPKLFFKRIINRILNKFDFKFVFVPDEFKVWVQIDQVPNISSFLEIKNGDLIESWSVGDSDVDFVLEIIEALKDLASKLNLEFTAESSKHLRSKERCFNLSHAHHPSSTLFLQDKSENTFMRMGKLSETSNFAIAGSAILPASGWINPTLLIMGMAFSITDELLHTT